MTTPVQPAPPDRPPLMSADGLACLLAGAAGAAALLVLVGVGALAPGPGLTGLLAVGAATLALAAWVRREAIAAATPAPPNSAAADAGPALAATLEALPSPLLVIAADNGEGAQPRVVFANPAAQAVLQVRGDGGPLVAAVRSPQVWEVVGEALFGREAGEASYETGGAQDRYCRAFASPLPDAEDGSRLALLIINDETDSRRNERMRSDFLANASHELKTPLASLTGFIETLRGHARDDPEARDKFLEIMAAQADRMSRLVADLMSLSRVELNEHIAPQGKVDLAMAAMDVIDALAPQAQEAGVTVTPQLPVRGAAVVVGDRDQIQQVIQNLVDNGLKYAGRGGGVTVAVQGGVKPPLPPRDPEAARLSLLTPDRTDSVYALVRVEDTGPGMRREHLPRLTERFYRVEGQKSGERLGTGLGLAIVKHIMNRHRGGLSVETSERGTAFLAYFPEFKPTP